MAQDYDKILKENLTRAIPFLLESLLQIKIVKVENLEIKLQYTLEREPDFLKIITDEKGKKHIFQVEFQTTDEDMRFRLLVYKALLIQREKLPVKQAVLFIGDKKVRKPNIYKDDDLTFRFHLIDLKTIPSHQFLNSNNPEEVIFAILADFENEKPDDLVDDILDRLHKLAAGQLHLEKYTRQLEIISKLRNLQKLTIEKIERMPIIYDIKTDIRYLQGKDEGLEEGIKEGKKKGIEESNTIVCISLLELKTFSTVAIANMLQSSVAFVEKVKNDLMQRKIVEKLLVQKLEIKEITKETKVSETFVKALQTIQKNKKT